jgi:hypothetical protein
VLQTGAAAVPVSVVSAERKETASSIVALAPEETLLEVPR